MSDIVIKAENLEKKYIIGHQEDSGKYIALREVLMQNARNFLRKTKDLMTGHPVIQGDTLEVVQALKDINFEIRRGEVVGIIGRNGAGKSTLLKILSRITEPSAGRVTIKGRVASLLEVGTGFHPELTGRENIYLNGAILGMSRAEIKKKFDEIVAFAEIEKFLDTPVKRYSSGMYVRLAFAVAAHLEPEILVIDEVLSVGDAAFQKKCLGKIGDVVKENKTVLFVSHNMAAIQSLCPCAFLLEAGRLTRTGAAGEVVSSYLDTVFHTSDDRNLSERRDRTGGSSLRLLRFDILDSKNESIANISCGKSFGFKITFKVFAEKIGNLRFGISVVDHRNGGYVTELNSYYRSADVYSCEWGVHDFVFKINKMSLAPGLYHLNLIVTAGLDVLDQIKDACQIRVIESSFYESGQMPLPGNYPIFFTEFECKIDSEIQLETQEI